MKYSLDGKQMEDARKRKEFATNYEKWLREQYKLSFDGFKKGDSGDPFVVFKHNKRGRTFDKPIYLRLMILEISKLSKSELHYDILQP